MILDILPTCSILTNCSPCRGSEEGSYLRLIEEFKARRLKGAPLQVILDILSTCSILTNCALVGFTSHGLFFYFPNMNPVERASPQPSTQPPITRTLNPNPHPPNSQPQILSAES